jgi:hypothetical protein
MSGRQFNIGNIPTSRILPDGYFDLRIANMEEAESRSGLFMYKLEFRVVAPEVCENRAHYEYLTIGKRPSRAEAGASEEWLRYCELDDPQGEDPLTQRYSLGLRNLKYILVAMDHKGAASDMIDMEEILDDFNIKNPKDQLRVGAKIVNAEGKDGRENNNISFYYEVGKEEPRLVSSNERKTNKPKPAVKKPQPRQVIEAEEFDDEDE